MNRIARPHLRIARTADWRVPLGRWSILRQASRARRLTAIPLLRQWCEDLAGSAASTAARRPFASRPAELESAPSPPLLPSPLLAEQRAEVCSEGRQRRAVAAQRRARPLKPPEKSLHAAPQDPTPLLAAASHLEEPAPPGTWQERALGSGIWQSPTAQAVCAVAQRPDARLGAARHLLRCQPERWRLAVPASECLVSEQRHQHFDCLPHCWRLAVHASECLVSEPRYRGH